MRPGSPRPQSNTTSHPHSAAFRRKGMPSEPVRIAHWFSLARDRFSGVLKPVARPNGKLPDALAMKASELNILVRLTSQVPINLRTG